MADFRPRPLFNCVNANRKSAEENCNRSGMRNSFRARRFRFIAERAKRKLNRIELFLDKSSFAGAIFAWRHQFRLF